MRKLSLVLLLLAALVMSVAAQDAVELRMVWYNDGNEGEVVRDLLDRFEADNPDIKVVIETVGYSDGILQQLPLQVQAGEAPDLARLTQFALLRDYYPRPDAVSQ
ncbi:MAG: extracellular solute-binding protein [Chloroflexi bacterium]|nr:extracellular solute-binding protein [Chloroflexota bacterium]